MINLKKLVFICLLFSVSFIFAQNDIDKVRNSEITKEEVYEHIKYLASDKLEGRFPGTIGGTLAMDYISKEFKTYGLTPYGDSSYIQPFDMITDLRLGKDNTLELIKNSVADNYKVEKDWTPLGYSSNGLMSGELVFLGYGISAPDLNYDDYKDIDVTGKIVVIITSSPTSTSTNNTFYNYESIYKKISKARDNKAAGIIVISGLETEDVLPKLTYSLASRSSGIPVIKLKREYIESIFKDLKKDFKKIQNNINNKLKPESFILTGWSVKSNINVEQVKAKTGNVIGFIEGNDPILKNEVIVLGAHYDHLGWGGENSLYEGKDKKIHYGADDNASGTTGVLEIAQKLSANKESLKRSVLFICFTGEEEGLIGSAYFTNSSIFSKLNIVTMINMDMIGRMEKEKLVINGTGTSTSWIKELDELNKKYSFTMSYIPDGFGPSDQSSFYSKNIPVLFFFTGLHTDYHKPSDTYDKINSEGEEKVAKFVYDLTLSIGNSEKKPDFTKVSESNDKKQETGPVKVYVGTIPDFSSNEEGYKISGVKEGSPADKGGIIAGDLMIKFGKKEIKNIYDYTAALGEHKPGDEVEVTVKRNNEELILKVILGKK
ncbi:MAG: M20/M25/M40 family metallo-hydrolase [Ignavibacteriae bacterium]|nr:M20/M25/M40 family metallo-hydrolase [Ignavibacteriota bacterium]